MTGDNVLEKTNRINFLYEFYHPLLTEKQQTFLKLYFHDNYSFGEIAQEYEISRQAVNEHIKRAELLLYDYEMKLNLLQNHENRLQIINQISKLIHDHPSQQNDQMMDLIQQLINME